MTLTQCEYQCNNNIKCLGFDYEKRAGHCNLNYTEVHGLGKISSQWEAACFVKDTSMNQGPDGDMATKSSKPKKGEKCNPKIGCA